MEWKFLNKKEAYEDYNRIIINGDASSECDISFLKLKKELDDAYDSTLRVCKIENGMIVDKYKFDCYFGIKLYEILLKPEYFLREHDASNDSIWRYLQILVIPSIIKSRVGENDDAFYNKPNRLYLKRIWWYIHLSLFQNDLEKTRELLLSSSNSTDTILQLVDRCGKKGYRIDLYREIMRYKSQNNVSGEKFRELLVLNNARLKVIDPYLVDGGIEKYVENIYGEIL